jgi:hypothetical protein
MGGVRLRIKLVVSEENPSTLISPGRVLTQITVMAPNWTENERENLKNPAMISRVSCPPLLELFTS